MSLDETVNDDIDHGIIVQQEPLGDFQMVFPWVIERMYTDGMGNYARAATTSSAYSEEAHRQYSRLMYTALMKDDPDVYQRTVMQHYNRSKQLLRQAILDEGERLGTGSD